MTGWLRVDTGALADSGSRLASQASAFDGISAASVASGHDDYGHAALANATGQLATRWAIGLEALATDVRAAGTALTQAAAAFEDVDAQAARAARNLAR
ncbi:hypothetical protein QUV83_10195 [Cellulomonas cellasea]|uniref:hypothetical protein n=1 Tax=Cellulomonas cellasea TaxID=43670 RepID=UPI0025A34EF8|nr:hypothetical protein [Cellulomonas cellasea]MDM8085135.1 hypothetical protein [Cellulomonas cellasea]